MFAKRIKGHIENDMTMDPHQVPFLLQRNLEFLEKEKVIFLQQNIINVTQNNTYLS